MRSLKRAVGHALSEEEERRPTTLVPVPEQQPPPDERAERITRREREVALLVGWELIFDLRAHGGEPRALVSANRRPL